MWRLPHDRMLLVFVLIVIIAQPFLAIATFAGTTPATSGKYNPRSHVSISEMIARLEGSSARGALVTPTRITPNTPLNVFISPSSACAAPGGNVYFTATGQGGTGSYTDFTWHWSGPTSGTSDTGTSPSYTFSQTPTGSYLVHVVITDSSSATTLSSDTTVVVSNSPCTAANLQILVYDIVGNPLQGATVTMISGPSGQSLLTGTTTAGGQYTFQNIQVGTYNVEVNDNGYISAQTGSIATQSGTTADTIVQLTSGTAVPSAPQNLMATGGANQISLSWTTPIATNGAAITGYRVYRGTTSGGETLLATLGAVLSYLDSAVSAGTTYYYKVSAVNSAGEGTQSSEVSATPGSTPSAPLNFQATPSTGQISLQWNTPSSNGGSAITGYNVYRGTSSGGESLLASMGVTTSYTDTAVTSGTAYYYYVKAVNAYGAGSQSNEASATVPTPNAVITVTSASVGTLTIGGSSQITIYFKNTGNTASQASSYSITLNFENDPNGPWAGILESALGGLRLIESDQKTVSLPSIAAGGTTSVIVTVMPSSLDSPSFLFTNRLDLIFQSNTITTNIDPTSQVVFSGNISVACGLFVLKDIILDHLVFNHLQSYVPSGAASADQAMANLITFISHSIINLSPDAADVVLGYIESVLADLYNSSTGGNLWQTLESELWNLVSGNFNEIFLGSLNCWQPIFKGVNVLSWMVALLFNYGADLAQKGYITVQAELSHLQSLIGGFWSWLIGLLEPPGQHDLYLLVHTTKGDVGRLANGTAIRRVIGSYFISFLPGVEVAVFNQTLTFNVNVDALNAQQAQETFNITALYSSGTSQTSAKIAYGGTITKGATSVYTVSLQSGAVQIQQLTGTGLTSFLLEGIGLLVSLLYFFRKRLWITRKRNTMTSFSYHTSTTWVNSDGQA